MNNLLDKEFDCNSFYDWNHLADLTKEYYGDLYRESLNVNKINTITEFIGLVKNKFYASINKDINEITVGPIGLSYDKICSILDEALKEIEGQCE